MTTDQLSRGPQQSPLLQLTLTTDHEQLTTNLPMKRNTAKVARLPRQLRELVNRSLDDGLAYKDIIAKLDDNAHLWPRDLEPFNEQNISNWFDGGYKDWL